MKVKMIVLRTGAVTAFRGEMSQTELARRSGVSRGTINRIERGHLESVTFGTINRLAKALAVDADALVTFDRA